MRVAIVHNELGAQASESERDVLVQAAGIEQALRHRGYEVAIFAASLDLGSLWESLKKFSPNVVFNLVESLGGSDRLAVLAPVLWDGIGLPYTGASSTALLATADKRQVKASLQEAQLPTPAWFAGSYAPWMANGGRRDSGACFPEGGRWILKGAWSHGSERLDLRPVVEIFPVEQIKILLTENEQASQQPWYAESFIEGREFNVALLASPGGLLVLPPSEILFCDFAPDKPRVVDYRAKWVESAFEYHATPRRFQFPPEDKALLNRLSDLAVACWHLFGLSGYARVDFRVDDRGQPWILEVNTNPCLAPDAGFAAILEEAGIDYADALAWIVDEALVRFGKTESCHRKGVRVPGVGGKRTRIIQNTRRANNSEPSLSQRFFGPTGPEHVAGPTGQPSKNSLTTYRAVGDKLVFRERLDAGDLQWIGQMVDATGVFRPSEKAIAVELAEERLRRGEASGYEFVIAEFDGQPIAYACFGPIGGTENRFDLYWIVVSPPFQGQGLGRRLMAEVESRVRRAGGSRIYVETSAREDYAKTRYFYERCGYRQECFLPDFYAPGDGKVIYVKDIASGLKGEESA